MCLRRPGCSLCGPTDCNPACGTCRNWQRVTYLDGNGAYDQIRKNAGVDINKRGGSAITMREQYQFSEMGDEPRNTKAYYLAKIDQGANNIERLKSDVHKVWHSVKSIIEQLAADGLITANGYAKYRLTEAGEREARKWYIYNGFPEPEKPIEKEPNNELNKTISVEEAPTVKKLEQLDIEEELAGKTGATPTPAIELTEWENKTGVHPTATKKRVSANTPKPELEAPMLDDRIWPEYKQPAEDQYIRAYHELLIERFGTFIKFTDVQERMKTYAAV